MDRLGDLATSSSEATTSSSCAFVFRGREKVITDATDADMNPDLLSSPFSAFCSQWWKNIIIS